MARKTKYQKCMASKLKGKHFRGGAAGRSRAFSKAARACARACKRKNPRVCRR